MTWEYRTEATGSFTICGSLIPSSPFYFWKYACYMSIYIFIILLQPCLWCSGLRLLWPTTWHLPLFVHICDIFLFLIGDNNYCSFQPSCPAYFLYPWTCLGLLPLPALIYLSVSFYDIPGWFVGINIYWKGKQITSFVETFTVWSPTRQIFRMETTVYYAVSAGPKVLDINPGQQSHILNGYN